MSAERVSEMKNQTLKDGLVSIIVPCYNVDLYLEDFIASIIAQTYGSLEVILVNDGATDSTGQMLREAVPRLQAEGYTVKLVEQSNRGLGGAVDTGLKHFTGEFLTWPDPDDWLLPNSIERRVQLMRENPDIGLLRSNAKLLIEATQEFDGHFMPLDVPPRRPVELFEDLLFLRGFYAPVCHFVRSKMFLKVHPDRSIYFTAVSSQNFQLLVPVVEVFPVLQVSEPLAVYRVREDSRSRAPNRTREKLMARFDQLLDLTQHTLPKLRTYRPDAMARLMNYHWRNRMLPTAFRAAMKDRATELVECSALPAWRKAAAKALIAIRCNGAFEAIDGRTKRVASRGLARGFDRLVRLPKSQMNWGADPLWAQA
ncbi:glycosyltransferase family 2 protein [Luteolibacter marinus]|uniref:glycosyltransferase family 2 protein n=1 Tax=Luteolibacter marinus TaxID=2776705 RepID=UPI0018679E4E|nr:glycosyltransferase family 2 protein [Luteolibacter marinus]